MKAAIRQFALELGFDECRFNTAAAPATAVQFQKWIAGKQHGEMSWLERGAEKRFNPQKVLPGAKSVICLAASYHTGSQRSEVRSQKLGVVARYARFDDYHDVLGERLKQVAQFVNQLGGAATRSLWYADTGPVLERDFAQRAGLASSASTPTSSAAGSATGFFWRKS